MQSMLVQFLLTCQTPLLKAIDLFAHLGNLTTLLTQVRYGGL